MCIHHFFSFNPEVEIHYRSKFLPLLILKENEDWSASCFVIWYIGSTKLGQNFISKCSDSAVLTVVKSSHFTDMAVHHICCNTPWFVESLLGCDKIKIQWLHGGIHLLYISFPYSHHPAEHCIHTSLLQTGCQHSSVS